MFDLVEKKETKIVYTKTLFFTLLIGLNFYN